MIIWKWFSNASFWNQEGYLQGSSYIAGGGGISFLFLCHTKIYLIPWLCDILIKLPSPHWQSIGSQFSIHPPFPPKTMWPPPHLPTPRSFSPLSSSTTNSYWALSYRCHCAVSGIKNSVTNWIFVCLFSCFTQGFVNTADSENRWKRVKKMVPDVWQVTLGVANKSLKKLRGKIGDKAKLM